MKKVLIIGATGMLGHKLCHLLPEMGFEVYATLRQSAEEYKDRPEIFGNTKLIFNIDVLAEGKVEQVINNVKPYVVVNCVGVIKQRPEVEDRYLSVGINSWLPHRLANYCERYATRFIHMSTDCVFDGKRGNYQEHEPTNASDLYGRSKELGETTEQQTNAVTIRTSIIGREIANPKKSLIEWFLKQKGQSIQGFTKAIYTGLTTNEMAKVIAIVINTPNICGLFHIASAPISKYDLLLTLRDIMKLDIDIIKDAKFSCNRSLIMDRFTKETGYKAPSWKEMLKEMAEDKTPYKKWN